MNVFKTTKITQVLQLGDSLNKRNNRVRRLCEIYAPCFASVLPIRETNSALKYGPFRSNMIDCLENSHSEAIGMGRYHNDDLRDTNIAVVAFIDETIQSSTWEGRDRWRGEKLFNKKFGSADKGGDKFYERLHDILGQRHPNIEVLEVYYHCLTLGFRGGYFRGSLADERLELIRKIYAHLANLPDFKDERLSLQGTPSAPIGAAIGKKVPAWLLPLIFISAIVICFLYMTGEMDQVVSQVLQRISLSSR